MAVLLATTVVAEATPADTLRLLDGGRGAPSSASSSGPVCDLLDTAASTTDPVPFVGPLVRTLTDALCAVEAGQVTYITVYDPPGPAGPERRTHTGLVGLPTPLDAGDSPLPDLTATTQPTVTGGASLNVGRAAGAPAVLPVSVEAVLSIPQSGSRKAAVGYDALASTAPGDFTATFAARATATSVSVETSAPGPSLGLIGELFTTGSNDARVDPTSLRIDLSPVPASIGVDIVDGANGGNSVKYRSSAPLDSVTGSFREMAGASIVQDAVLNLEGVPTEIDVNQPASDTVELVANTPIGLVEAAIARGGPVRQLDPINNPSYAYIVDDGGFSSRAVRARGVQHATAVINDGAVVDATLQSGPFRLKLEDGARQVDVSILNLPAQVHLAYSATAGTLSYTASDPIAEVSATAVDPSGLLGRATNISLLAQSLPTSLSLGFSQSGNTVSVDAHGAQIGLIQLTATNGPSPTIASARDGIQLMDRGAPYLLFARLTGLKKATATLAPDPDVFIDTIGNQVFEADLNTGTASNPVYLRAVLDRLQPATRVRVVPQGNGSKVAYTAAAATSSLFFTTNGDDDNDFVEASMAPLPAAFELCTAGDNSCGSSSNANGGTVRFTASEHTTVNLFECRRPLTGCTAANATESTMVTNLRVRSLGLETNVNGPPLVSSGNRVFLDTDNHQLTGQVERRLDNPIVNRIAVNLPAGFRAENRTVQWGFPSFGNPSGIIRTGTITCPSGTAFDIRLINVVTIDVDSFIC